MPNIFDGKIFVPSNLRKNKQNIIGKFDFRDLTYIFIIGAIALPIYFLLKDIDITLAGILAITPSLLIAYVAFRKWDNMKFEDYIFFKYSNNIKSKPVRINFSENIYERLDKINRIDIKKANNKEKFSIKNILKKKNKVVNDIEKYKKDQKSKNIKKRGLKEEDGILKYNFKNNSKHKNIDKKKVEKNLKYKIYK